MNLHELSILNSVLFLGVDAIRRQIRAPQCAAGTARPRNHHPDGRHSRARSWPWLAASAKILRRYPVDWPHVLGEIALLFAAGRWRRPRPNAPPTRHPPSTPRRHPTLCPANLWSPAFTARNQQQRFRSLAGQRRDNYFNALYSRPPPGYTYKRRCQRHYNNVRAIATAA